MNPNQNTPTSRFRLSPRFLARVEGWGMAVDSLSYLYQPRTVDEIREVFELARAEGLPIALRGGGRSYGDASINDRGIVLDLSRMNRILQWNTETGRVVVEPGVTIEKLWKSIIGDGWWPPVVSGTMYTTMGGCAAMNIHGKNNFTAGPFGNHIVEFDLLTPKGEVITCTREQNSELFHAAISGFGMLGCFTRLVLQMKKVYSGLLSIEAFDTKNLPHMVEEFEERVHESDYLVGWVDCMAGGRGLGRGIVHQANYLAKGADPDPDRILNVKAQELPGKLFGVLPKSLMYILLNPFVNNPGMRLVNASKYWSSHLMPRGHKYLQSHAAFAFLLDYVPNWKWSYKPIWGNGGDYGLIQYQAFVPKERAIAVFETLIRESKKEGLPAYLGVFKKHQPDPFLMTHAVDGYSLALDYRVTPGNRDRLWAMCNRLDRMVLKNGGRFYFAKDATLQADAIDAFFPAKNLAKMVELKGLHDPENLLQTNLSRRLFGKWFDS